jgi:ribosomal protein RSM22 (predicted rRNA methylase)
VKKIYPFPDYIKPEIDRLFSEKKWTWDFKHLAEDVLQLSDFYINNPDGETPWQKEWAQRANLVYFWPLNTLRLEKIIDDLNTQKFFAGLSELIDYGAGLGTATWALQNKFAKKHLVEKSSIPSKLFPEFNWQQQARPDHKSLTVFSYSLTELDQLPTWSLQSEALLIIEPSTQQDGRKLLELREKLIEQKYLMWSPCPHQGPCPLFTQSKTDWCHDRVHIQKPEWFEKIEKYLPIKNNTLTFSYLAARRTPPPERKWARLVGDQLVEKGKTRQMICRGSEREFLAWMHRDGDAPELSRGDRVFIESFEKKSNELRKPAVSHDE